MDIDKPYPEQARTPVMRIEAWRAMRIGVGLTIALLLSACAGYRHHSAGLEAMARGDYVSAVDHLRTASEIDPTEVRYRSDWLQQRDVAMDRLAGIAENALSAGRLESARESLAQMKRIMPGHPRLEALVKRIELSESLEADVAEAAAQLAKGETARAMLLARQALTIDPKHSRAQAIKREIEAGEAKAMLNTASLAASYRKPVNLEFRDATVRMVFEALSRSTGINFIFDRDVRTDQRTTLFLKQAPIEDVLEVILTTNQLSKKVLNESSILIYPATAAKAKEYQDLMVKAYYLANVEAKQASTLLKSVLKIKEIYVDEKRNLLVLREPAETIDLADRLLALNDLDEPEVMLEVEVLEVNRARLMELGVKITDQLTVTPLPSVLTQGTGGAISGSSAVLKLSELDQLRSDQLGVTVPSVTATLRKEDGDAKLLANPRIRVRDREKARVMIGDKVPVVTATATPNGFLSESVQYLDVGLKLEVEPEVRLRDEIGLKVSLEVSSLVATVKTNNGSQAYQIGTRSASSALRLRNGETQILAGLISDEDRSAANRIPLLGDLPVLGRLFSNQKDDRRRTEIVLSITPRLVRNMQRQHPATEVFWSGTENAIRNAPLQLRAGSTSSSRAAGPTTDDGARATTAPRKPKPQSTGVDASNGGPQDSGGPGGTGLSLKWSTPSRVGVGDRFSMDLEVSGTTGLRALPLQVQLDSTRLELLGVREGDYFSRSGRSTFTHQSGGDGRVNVGIAGLDAAAQGKGSLIHLELRALKAGPAAVQVVAATPVQDGGGIAPRPNLPIDETVHVGD